MPCQLRRSFLIDAGEYFRREDGLLSMDSMAVDKQAGHEAGSAIRQESGVSRAE